MRTALSITFLLAYLSICTGPIFPFLEYWLDYDLIVAEKCENVNEPALECNGKCYLSKELAKASETQSSDDEQSGEVDVRAIELHDQTGFEWACSLLFDLLHLNQFNYKAFIPFGFESDSFEPPEM